MHHRIKARCCLAILKGDALRTKEETIRLIVSEFGYNPLEALGTDFEGSDKIPPGRHVYEDVPKLLAWHGADLLLPFLKSKDADIALDALFVFSEMESEGAELTEAAAEFLDHPYDHVRWNAMEGLLFRRSKLSPRVLALCLRAADDETLLVRTKAIEFIAASTLSKLEAALEFFSSQDRVEQHKRGLEILTRSCETAALIDQIACDEKIISCYTCAKILRNAKEGELIDISDEKVTSEEVAFLKFKLEIMSRRFPDRYK